MTKEDFAFQLNGREIRNEIDETESTLAYTYNLIVIYGYSDDNMELRGAIDDEVGCYDGGTYCIFKNKKGWQIKSEEEIQEMREKLEEDGFDFDIKTHEIEAVWSPEEPECSWMYKTEIPHATFDIMEDGELFCRGIVISTNDLN